MSYCLLVLFIFCAINYKVSIYLCYQAKGQLVVLFNRQSITDFERENNLSKEEKENLRLIEAIKKYSIDSLGYKPTNNFTRIYNQKKSATLWVITASFPYKLKPYEWTFPMVGTVSYKGFFKKDLADLEFNRLRSLGYDVDLRSVSAWSTLGWFNDPLLSSMLHRSKGGLCNLLFHELLHATYYQPNAVNFNENIANFIAHKATIQFLKNDSLALKQYLNNYSDNLVFSNFMQRQNTFLKRFYQKIENSDNKLALKLQAINSISDSVRFLRLINPKLTEARQKDILTNKNAYFIDFEQYDSMQDSLEDVFNKIYKGNIKKLVQDLKLNQINY